MFAVVEANTLAKVRAGYVCKEGEASRTAGEKYPL